MAKKLKEIKVEELSARAQSSIKAKRVMGANNFNYWQTLLAELAAFDDLTDQLRSKAQNRAILCGVGTFIAGIGSVIAGANATDARTYVLWGVCVLAGLGAAVLLVLTIIFWAKYSALKKVDLANDFRLTLMPVLDELSEDIKPQAPLKIDLDLKGVVPQKIISKKKIPPGRFKSVTETIYRDHWLKMMMKLTDKSVLILDIENTFIEHDRRWRNARGKSKQKSKWKKLVLVSATVDPGSDEVEWDNEKIDLKAQNEKLKVKEKAGEKILRLSRKYKFSAVGAPPDMAVKPTEVVGLFIELFALLKPTGEAPQPPPVPTES